MSHIYIQEPPTYGKVLLKTSLGDIDIELWSKEAPKACRNFVQLCLEGYYNGTIFHRVVKDFIAQGGDPTGTGAGGECIYGKPFKDEFHQRLKFNRRGLVAMANAGQNDNGSQFFFTLDRADELNKKHTIFGKVAGHTIYNMVRFNDLDVGEDERPTAPPKIFKCEVLSNPFDDLVPRKSKEATDDKESKQNKIKSKSKATKNFKLLSFGEEAEEDEEETDQYSKGLQSSHDVLNDPKLSSQPAVDPEKSQEDVKENTRKKLKRDHVTKQEKTDVVESEETEDAVKQKRRKALQEEAKKLKKELKQDKTNAVDKDTKKESKKEKEPVNDLMKTLVEERKTFLKTKKDNVLLKKGGSRENETLALLAGFESKLVDVSSEDVSKSGEEEEDKQSWMSHKLNFELSVERAKDANMKGEDWYDIYDPRNPINKRKREKTKSSKKR